MTFTTIQQVYDALPGYQTRILGSGAIGTGLSRATPQRLATSYNLLAASPFAAPPAAPGAICDRSTVGALALPNVVSGHMVRVARARAKYDVSNQGWWLLTDRLVGCALDPSLTTVQTLNTVALPARAPANGFGVQMAFENFNTGTFSGASVATFSVTYTNDQGTTSTASRTFPQAWNAITGATRDDPIPLAAGDQGVRSVQSVQITSGAATSSGNVLGLVLYVPIFMFDGKWRYEQSAPFGGEQQDWLDAALAPFDPDSCLELITGGTASGLGLGAELDLVAD